jgi:glycosyltransferase involved in cell wall biosynthesis
MISVVTPSLNQGEFIETAILSVLTQGSPAEYVVVDGGSEDGTLEVVRRYGSRLEWTSEPDRGQYDALNKGFARTTGEIMAWLNADDFYLPGCFAAVEDIFDRFPEVDWICGTMVAIANSRGQLVRVFNEPRLSKNAFLRGFNLPNRGWHGGHFIPQESTFWRRSLWEEAGGRVDSSLSFAGDIELWSRFYRHSDLFGVRAVLAAYRSHPTQKTSASMPAYLAEAERVLLAAGVTPYGPRETSWRRRLAPHVTNDRLWRLPTAVRGMLEKKGLISRAAELMWYSPTDVWAVNTTYFL